MPSINDNPFIGLGAEFLKKAQDEYSECILAVANVGQTYQINGRTWTAANLVELRNTLQQINQAIAKAAGNLHQFATPIFPRRN